MRGRTFQPAVVLIAGALLGYVAATGPFVAQLDSPLASRKEAEVFAARQGVPPDPWLRPLSSLQKAIQPGNR